MARDNQVVCWWKQLSLPSLLKRACRWDGPTLVHQKCGRASDSWRGLTSVQRLSSSLCANTLHINGFWNSRPDRERAVHKTGRDSAIYFSSAIGKPPWT